MRLIKYGILACIAAALSFLISASLLREGGEQSSLVLRLAEAHHVHYPTVRALSHMAEVVEKRSGGRIRVKIYAGGQLGSEKDTVLANRIKAIDLNRVNLSLYNNIEPKTTIPALPYLFRSKAHMFAVMEGEAGKEILDSLRAHGLVPLAFYDSGARSFYTKGRTIRTPKDLEGLKIRVQTTDVSVAMVKALGASPTPMGFGEVYEALATGVIDGAENNLPSYRSTRHFEVARHFTLDEHSMVPEILTISEKTWEKLTQEDQGIILEAAQESMRVMEGLWSEAEKQSFQEVAGAKNAVFKDVDKAPFIEAMRPVYKLFANTPDLIDLKERIQATKERET